MQYWNYKKKTISLVQNNVPMTLFMSLILKIMKEEFWRYYLGVVFCNFYNFVNIEKLQSDMEFVTDAQILSM